MFLGYNTNGLAHHDLLDAVDLLADLGYQGVAITIDHGAIPPHAGDGGRQIERLRRALQGRGMRSVIETGARFLLDPRRKHEPTLLTRDAAERRRRIDFYRYAIDCAAALGSDCVSLWSGVLRDSVPRGEAIGRLCEGLDEVCRYAAGKGVVIAFEPEPGMLIDTTTSFQELLGRISCPNLALTLDIGHLHCQGEVPIAAAIRENAGRLANVHIEDMRRGVHEHLMFGEGEIDFPPVLAALKEIGYDKGVYVELSRHSHEGPEAARRAIEFLRAMM